MKDRQSGTIQPVSATGQGTSSVTTRLPIDLLGVAGVALVAIVLLAVVEITSPVVRVVVGVPLLFLAPGYATVSILFPRASALESTDDRQFLGQTRTVSDGERLALAFGLSVALLPMIGLTMVAATVALTGPAIVTTVGMFVLGGVLVAALRRGRVPAGERYSLRFGRKLSRLWGAIVGGSVVHTAVNVVLVVSMLVALTSVGYAFVSPQQGEQYTSLELLSEDDSGEYVASDYPTELEPGEPVELTVAVENQEGADTDYTAVVQEQWVDDGDVIDRTTHDDTSLAVSDDETVHADLEVTPEAESGTVRVAVLLYDGSPPEEPTTDNAYRYAYVWVDIDEPIADD